ncbi:hypothetical protein K0M31_010692 [Melipona bicolor]|uniref:Uncharacterized protein n=1 Tax=Melipona bicolor TaxID=60889 RepID=A0AA40FL23_9HYME|nr:hypothetical protein K0M31_010692 [Melipona bicolor]
MVNFSTEAAAAAAAEGVGEGLTASKSSQRSSLETKQSELLIKSESSGRNEIQLRKPGRGGTT